MFDILHLFYFVILLFKLILLFFFLLYYFSIIKRVVLAVLDNTRVLKHSIIEVQMVVHLIIHVINVKVTVTKTRIVKVI